ncbi:hypothetical protein NIES37_23230 [Tolypothrix tenuis PCC 7101]|uniref:Uncharacterized protein n=1 Tax=Tolypothrix tenuis PCC 7101 TaxID=231146 RepID=A0A1Z4MY46_9CYAN|nr:hypothetical protein [Aulosira sp. FACHB-113]BAY98373.1 hypothetical protein NIES37_23230 [Tolypothrix tenuis PCC 7101]BAZ77708.1 hypothetical protein NIES50_63390 [Aulosira laxa NIES-50]
MPSNSLISEDLNSGFARLQAIQWDRLGMGEKDERLTELMVEFLSRIREWAKFLQSEQRHIFQNLAIQIRPNIELPCFMVEWLEELKDSNRIQPWRGRSYVIQGLYNYLSWCYLKEIDAVPNNSLSDPYEPLIKFLELGGGIYVEHGYFMDIYPNYVHFFLAVDNDKPER